MARLIWKQSRLVGFHGCFLLSQLVCVVDRVDEEMVEGVVDIFLGCPYGAYAWSNFRQ